MQRPETPVPMVAGVEPRSDGDRGAEVAFSHGTDGDAPSQLAVSLLRVDAQKIDLNLVPRLLGG